MSELLRSCIIDLVKEICCFNIKLNVANKMTRTSHHLIICIAACSGSLLIPYFQCIRSIEGYSGHMHAIIRSYDKTRVCTYLETCAEGSYAEYFTL